MHVPCICVLQTILIVKITQVLAGGSEVKTDCSHGVSTVKITYFGDAKGVLATTKDGLSCFFTENKAAASFELIVPYVLKKGFGHLCKMDKKGDMKIYSITVKARMEHKDFTSINDEAFLVQCNFEPSTSDVGGAADMAESVKQPIIVSENVATLSSSTLSMSFLRVDDKEFSGAIEMGRKMKIKVVMKAAAGDIGFKATSCKATSSDGQATRMLLVDGCGVGLPWGNKAGFTTKGLIGHSPTFTMFRVKRNQDVIFSCDFTVCKKKCDGSSCSKSRRRKREIENEGNEILPVSQDAVKKNGIMLNSATFTKDFRPFIVNKGITNTTTQSDIARSYKDQHEDNPTMANIPAADLLAEHLITDEEPFENDLSPEADIKVTPIPPYVIRDLMSANRKPARGVADDTVTRIKTLKTNVFLDPFWDKLDRNEGKISNHIANTGNKFTKLESKVIGTSSEMLSSDGYRFWEKQNILDSAKQNSDSLPNNDFQKCIYLGMCVVMVILVTILLISNFGKKYSFLGQNNQRFV